MARKKTESTTNITLPVKNTTNSNGKKPYVVAVGRRREAVARVRLYREFGEPVTINNIELTKGAIIVNGMSIEQYFPGDVAKAQYRAPLHHTNMLNSVALTIRVTGGGKNGQLDAVIHGISRVLSTVDKEKARPILKKRGFLTRDARVRERRKVGTGGKARRKKQSPKR